MRKVKIYLRSIEQKGEKRLALFDSNRNGDINDLVTEVEPGAKIVWTKDCCSGIKSISKIFSKKGDGTIFKMEPRKRFFCSGFTLIVPKDAKGEEAYNISYVLCDGKEISIDPYIKIIPPI
jgi:hypothetical protein